MTHEHAEQPGAIRVLVVDDQRLMRDGIASLLGIQDGIEVVGTASNGQEALASAADLRPDVVLMDMRMPVMDGVSATARLRRELPTCQVLMLTTFDDEQYIVEALRAGAVGYLLKDIPAADLAKAIQAAHKGIYQLDPSVAGKVLASLTYVPSPDSSYSQEPESILSDGREREMSSLFIASELTSREIEVLKLIARGATNREIARKLVISEGTVKNHISSILSRLGLRDRTQAAIYAKEKGLL